MKPWLRIFLVNRTDRCISLHNILFAQKQLMYNEEWTAEIWKQALMVLYANVSPNEVHVDNWSEDNYNKVYNIAAIGAYYLLQIPLKHIKHMCYELIPFSTRGTLCTVYIFVFMLIPVHINFEEYVPKGDVKEHIPSWAYEKIAIKRKILAYRNMISLFYGFKYLRNNFIMLNLNALNLIFVLMIHFLCRRYVPALKKMPLRYLFDPWNPPLSEQEKAGYIIGKDPNPMV